MAANKKSSSEGGRGEEKLLVVLVGLLIALLVLLLVGGAFLYLQFQKGSSIFTPSSQVVQQPTQEIPPSAIAPPIEKETVQVYFISPTDLKLAAEPHEISGSRSLTQRIQKTLDALFAGPSTSDLRATVNPSSKVLSVFCSQEERRVYLDLNAIFYRNLPGNTLAEWAVIYSVVNTLCGLSEEIETVVFLEEGQPVIQSPGNLVWNRPFRADLAWTRYSQQGQAP